MVSALNMQVDNLRGKLDDLQLNLKREKQKTNKLNMKINRLESEKTMNRTISTYSNRSGLMKLNSTASLVPLQEPSEELKNKYVLFLIFIGIDCFYVAHKMNRGLSNSDKR